ERRSPCRARAGHGRAVVRWPSGWVPPGRAAGPVQRRRRAHPPSRRTRGALDRASRDRDGRTSRRGTVAGRHRDGARPPSDGARQADELVAVDDVALATARAEFYSERLPLTGGPPLRVRVARRPAGDLVMLSMHHAASDGLGSLRVLLSILRAYGGVPDPVPDVDPLAVRDLGMLLPADDLAARARRLLAFFDEVRKVRARVAPEGATNAPGFGLHAVRLSASETAGLKTTRDLGATINDVLLAGLHLAIHRWNEEHGAACDRIAVMTPVNLRPRNRWHEIVGNFSSFVTVSTRRKDRATPTGTVAAVARR